MRIGVVSGGECVEEALYKSCAPALKHVLRPWQRETVGPLSCVSPRNNKQVSAREPVR